MRGITLAEEVDACETPEDALAAIDVGRVAGVAYLTRHASSLYTMDDALELLEGLDEDDPGMGRARAIAELAWSREDELGLVVRENRGGSIERLSIGGVLESLGVTEEMLRFPMPWAVIDGHCLHMPEGYRWHALPPVDLDAPAVCTFVLRSPEGAVAVLSPAAGGYVARGVGIERTRRPRARDLDTALRVAELATCAHFGLTPRDRECPGRAAREYEHFRTTGEPLPEALDEQARDARVASGDGARAERGEMAWER